jgi:hypothetical protein
MTAAALNSSTFDKVLAEKFVSEETMIKQILNCVRQRHPHVIENLKTDCCIEPVPMYELLLEVIQTGTPLLADPTNLILIRDVQTALKNKCSDLIARYIEKNECYSPYIEDGEIVQIGRGLSASRFKQHLHSLPFDYTEIKSALADISILPLPPHLENLPLANPRYNIWVTWNKKDASIDPFEFAGDAALKKYKYPLVKTCLGLDLQEDDTDFVILRFRKQSDRLKYPTFVDAGFYARFKAVRHEHGVLPPHGETEPRRPDEFFKFTGLKEEDFIGFFPPLPEAMKKGLTAKLSDLYEDPETLEVNP